ncbi:hypothetical protein TNCV_2314271 [Trichonephila clavipes]|nr:hypothetical protein TNCV_2314271 [Trichonephila clavipes]
MSSLERFYKKLCLCVVWERLKPMHDSHLKALSFPKSVFLLGESLQGEIETRGWSPALIKCFMNRVESLQRSLLPVSSTGLLYNGTSLDIEFVRETRAAIHSVRTVIYACP